MVRKEQSIIPNGDFEVQITALDKFDEEIIVISDGFYESKLEFGSILEIVKAKIETVFLRFPDFGFFNRLQGKLDF